MQRARPMLAQGFQMIGGGVTFMPAQAVLGVHCVPLLHARVAMGFGQDGSSGDGDAAGISVDQGFLFDQNIEFDGVQQQVIGQDRELIERCGHGLAAGLVNIPGVNALRIDLRDRPCQRVLANARRKLPAALGHQFFGIVQADNSSLGIQDYRGVNRKPAPAFI